MGLENVSLERDVSEDEDPEHEDVLDSEEEDVDFVTEVFPFLSFSRSGGTVRILWTKSFGRGSGCFLRRSGRFTLVGLPKGMNSVLGVSLGLEDLMVVLNLGSLGFL